MAKNDKAQESAQKKMVKMTFQQMHDFATTLRAWEQDKVDAGELTFALSVNAQAVESYLKPFRKTLDEKIQELNTKYEVLYFNPTGMAQLKNGQYVQCLSKKDGTSLDDLLKPGESIDPTLPMFTFENANKFLQEFSQYGESQSGKESTVLGAIALPKEQLMQLGKNPHVSPQQLGTLLPFMVED